MTGKSSRLETGRRVFAFVAGLVLLCLAVASGVVGIVLLFVGGDFSRVLWGIPADEVTGVIRETVQPAHVSFWLAPARGCGDDD